MISNEPNCYSKNMTQFGRFDPDLDWLASSFSHSFMRQTLDEFVMFTEKHRHCVLATKSFVRTMNKYWNQEFLDQKQKTFYERVKEMEKINIFECIN